MQIRFDFFVVCFSLPLILPSSHPSHRPPTGACGPVLPPRGGEDVEDMRCVARALVLLPPKKPFEAVVEKEE